MGDTVRARLIAEPASPETIRDARRRLIELGFHVEAEDPGGIAFDGDAERFRQVFGDPAAPELVVPDELASVAAGVVIPRSPELFP